MIGFFPVPYPDEILYSVFARYHHRSKNRYVAATLNDLFGHEAARIVVDLPNKLGYLANQLPSGSIITAARLIDDHTLFPFYEPFLPPDRKDQLRQDMIERSIGGTIHGRLGILTSNISVEYLRFCPLCVEDDIKSFGEPYWHRIHQVPGVFTCSQHSTFLENSSVECFYRNREKTLRPARKELFSHTPRYIDLDNKDHLTYLFISHEASWLLNQKTFQSGGPDFFRKRFLHILCRKNLATHKSFSVDKLHAEFEAFYSPKLLASLSSTLENKHTWLKRLIQSSHHFQHPVRNLLLLNFLECTLEEFINIPEEIYPFGKPPFPCLNSASDHFREMIIKTVKINKTVPKGEVAGTFECTCGFIYRRFGWDEMGERKFEYDYVNSYGEIFYKKLLKLKKSGLSRNEMASVLKLPRGTINSQLRILKANGNVPINKDNSISKSKFDKLRNQFRKRWLKLQKQNPNLGRSKLGLLDRRVYQWLTKNDRDWFELNSPARKIIKEKENRIDWETRDENLSKQVYETAKEILETPGYPVWISKTFLSKSLKIHHVVVKRPECIPKTIEALHNNTETKEEFIARRIRFAADCFIQEKMRTSYWKIIMRANVMRPHLIKLPKVQEAIRESLEKAERSESNGWAS